VELCNRVIDCLMYDQIRGNERRAIEGNLGSGKKSNRPHGWLGLSITRAVLLQGVMRTHIPETPVPNN
jgi:hypothetical protein